MKKLILICALVLAGCGGGGDDQVDTDCTAVPPCMPVAHVGGAAQ